MKDTTRETILTYFATGHSLRTLITMYAEIERVPQSVARHDVYSILYREAKRQKGKEVF